MIPLQATVLALAILGATAVVLMRDAVRMVIVDAMYGLVLAVLFVVLGAPDVALSMLVVGTVGYPLILLVAIARARGRR